MRESGVVIKVQDDICEVLVKRETACGESCENCTSQCNKQQNKVNAKNYINAKIGDKVLIEAPTKDVLKSAFLVYIMPLILLFSGYMLTEYITKSEIASIICGVFLFVLTFIVLHFWDKKNKNKITTTIIKVLGEE